MIQKAKRLARRKNKRKLRVKEVQYLNGIMGIMGPERNLGCEIQFRRTKDGSPSPTRIRRSR